MSRAAQLTQEPRGGPVGPHHLSRVPLNLTKACGGSSHVILALGSLRHEDEAQTCLSYCDVAVWRSTDSRLQSPSLSCENSLWQSYDSERNGYSRAHSSQSYDTVRGTVIPMHTAQHLGFTGGLTSREAVRCQCTLGLLDFLEKSGGYISATSESMIPKSPPYMSTPKC